MVVGLVKPSRNPYEVRAEGFVFQFQTYGCDEVAYGGNPYEVRSEGSAFQLGSSTTRSRASVAGESLRSKIGSRSAALPSDLTS